MDSDQIAAEARVEAEAIMAEAREREGITVREQQRYIEGYIAGSSRPAAPTTRETVEALHQPEKVWESDRSYTLVCRECTLRAWPCPTYQAITKKGDNREDSRIS